MRLLLVIDHLGLGGAQRQIVELACGLAQRGHSVELFSYFPEHDYFLRRVLDQGIAVHDYRKGRGFSLGVVAAIMSLLRSRNFAVAISFLNNPNIYAELASVASRQTRLVVSERCSYHDDHSVLAANARRGLHVLADHVVTNSETHAAWLRRKRWLRAKVSCIYNGLDLQALAPARDAPAGGAPLRLLAVGRVCAQKNPLNLIAGLERFHRKHGYVPEVSWAGKQETSGSDQRYVAQVNELLQSLPQIAAHWHWLGEQRDMPALLRRHDALIHPSLYEGLPNAACEALAAGLPVLISDVCDHSRLVGAGARGFLFDPNDAASIAGSIEKLAALDVAGRLALSRNARSYAEEHLGVAKMLDSYERLCISLAAGHAGVTRGTAQPW
jgi:glycosyltransferase involved in cell wall biosynthesis